ncbi:MAG: homoserine dehydrogenase [Halioglobus sp.]
MKPVRIGICGLGTVGGSTYQVLSGATELLSARAGAQLSVSHIGARRDNPNCATGDTRISRDIFDVAYDPQVDILVELIGGTTVAKDLIEAALVSGKHVVTANKALIAEFGSELFALADKHGVVIRYEAAVAGGIPIIKALREGLAGNKILWLAGIINGTGNFILTEMKDKGRAFTDVLAEAQALGYAEADPTFDVEGIDAAHKLVILAAIAFGMPLEFTRVYTEGISKITPRDVNYAQELGYCIKHLGIAKQSGAGVELRVHPTLIPERRLLANVDGVKNAVMVEGSAVGPTLYYGAGAGGDATASAVVADVIDLARDIAAEQQPQVVSLGVAQQDIVAQTIVPMDRVVTPWYVRLEAEDRAGVMAQITALFSDEGISIEALIQKAPSAGESKVPVIVLTNAAAQGRLKAVIVAMDKLESIADEIMCIRVETLDV